MKTPMANRNEVRGFSLTVPMSEKEKAKVKKKSKELGITMSGVVRIALNEFLKKEG